MTPRRSVAAILLAAALSTQAGCYVRDSSGGYAAECERKDAEGWAVSTHGSLQRTIGTHVVDLSTSHLYYSDEPAALILVSAHSFSAPGGHHVSLDPSLATLTVAGKTVRPLPGMRESPFMQPRCEGALAPSTNLNDCGPAVVTFPGKIADGEGFVLHLQSLTVDGTVYPVPDIKYCYLPRTSKWVKFHG